MLPPTFLSSLPLPFQTHSSLSQALSSRRPRACPISTQCRMGVNSPSYFKQALLDTLAPLELGRAVSSDLAKKEEIEKLIVQVEATNPSKSPGTDPNLTAAWKLIYTTSDSILGIEKPPYLQPSRIVQELNGDLLTGRNLEYYSFGPVEISNSVEAKLTPVSSCRFDVNFIRFVVFGFIPINVEKNPRFSGWLEVSYLDDNLRISRGNRGNVFVLVK